MGCSLAWLLLLRGRALEPVGLLQNMWDLPETGIEPISPASAGRFLTTGPPGKSKDAVFLVHPYYDHGSLALRCSTNSGWIQKASFSSLSTSHTTLSYKYFIHSSPSLANPSVSSSQMQPKVPLLQEAFLEESHLTASLDISELSLGHIL